MAAHPSLQARVPITGPRMREGACSAGQQDVAAQQHGHAAAVHYGRRTGVEAVVGGCARVGLEAVAIHLPGLQHAVRCRTLAKLRRRSIHKPARHTALARTLPSSLQPVYVAGPNLEQRADGKAAHTAPWHA